MSVQLSKDPSHITFKYWDQPVFSPKMEDSNAVLLIMKMSSQDACNVFRHFKELTHANFH